MKNNPLIPENSVREPVKLFELKLAPELIANAETLKSFESKLAPELNANAETFRFFESKLAPELNTKADIEQNIEPAYRRELL